jgi:hypothetical protein
MQQGDKRLMPPIQETSEAVLTPVVIGELLFGFLGGGLEPRNRTLLDDRFKRVPQVFVEYFEPRS